MSTTDVERLRSIKTFPSLVKYLRDELDWPIELDHFEDLDPITFDYEPEELGIDSKIAVKIKQIKRLRRLCPNQPWGVFFVNFVPKRLPVMVLRRILQQLVPRKRASASRASQQTWQPNDLLFVSAYGEDEQRQISFAHFAENKEMGDLPVLKVLGWDKDDTAFHLADAHEALKAKLKWPGDEDNIKTWRETWSSAFVLRHREVVDTSKKLAIELADLATNIRTRVNQVLAVEDPEKGPMRKLMAGFKEALIHDLSEDDFADMYAQTIAYGLLAAAISRHVPGEELVLLTENIADMVPVTNPFLKELLSTFLTVGGRRNKLDFDELGVNDIIDLLRNANLTAVLHDFGNQNPLEDPVIHFYELFLKEYDSKKRTQRGVFYTPKPIVSFIVRSVHEILKKDFDLESGLADTTTCGELAKRIKGINIPDGISPNEPFVQILDPATGTGTFLVETIDVIYKTMIEKWENEGHMPLEFSKLWNEYVPTHLLPRLYGFELLMAPYTIAHMKIGLKLKETGYSFQSDERARIYLTNTLEEPKNISEYFEQMAPALAHEAKAVNEIKRHQQFTVVIGNPPYSVSTANESEWIDDLLIPYKAPVREETNIGPLSDDYVKFLAFVEHVLQLTGSGILGMITNNSFLSGLVHRGMRASLLRTFHHIDAIDLGGNSALGDRAPDGSVDQNVFEIQQGVSVSIMRTLGEPEVLDSEVYYLRISGKQDMKYQILSSSSCSSLSLVKLDWRANDYCFFVPKDFSRQAEFEKFVSLSEMFPVGGTCVETRHDSLLVAFTREELVERMAIFGNLKIAKNEVEQKLGIKDTRTWSVEDVRRIVARTKEDRIEKILYRPFDYRWVYYDSRIIERGSHALPTMRHLLILEGNLALISARQVARGTGFDSALVTRGLAEKKCADSTRSSYAYPLMLISGDLIEGSGHGQLNLGATTRKWWENVIAHSCSPNEPWRILTYAYAILHSPAYRKRYAEFLKIDFPRVPLIENKDLFRELCSLGSKLVSLHLMESATLKNHITTFPVSGDNKVAKVGERGKTLAEVENGKGKLFINNTQYFEGLPEEVWNFHIGGYQVCHKWLASRK